MSSSASTACSRTPCEKLPGPRISEREAVWGPGSYKEASSMCEGSCFLWLTVVIKDVGLQPIAKAILKS